MKKFEEYSKEHVNFYEPCAVPVFVRGAIELFRTEHKMRMKLIDVGCGDANILSQVIESGLAGREEVTGVDPSPIRLERASDSVRVIKGFAERLPFKTGKIDVVLSSQVIEHLKDDKVLVSEAKRVLKKDGIFYVSSVVKKPYGIWIYWKKGYGFISDPTHYREYNSRKEFEKLVESGGFEVISSKISLFKHSIVDLFIRLLIKLKIVKPERVVRIYEKRPILFFLRNILRIPVIGFYNVEVLARKK
tara:strand:- start:750 stop:1490 length:741 start_codon:yes stop_codon:yes gene_type:complete